jgi:hypothetical protein
LPINLVEALPLLIKRVKSLISSKELACQEVE